MSQAVITGEVRWYRLLDRSQWNTLIASNLGWMFDGYETFALVMAVGRRAAATARTLAIRPDSRLCRDLIALTLLGWGIGGLIGGVIADYLGRSAP